MSRNIFIMQQDTNTCLENNIMEISSDV